MYYTLLLVAVYIWSSSYLPHLQNDKDMRSPYGINSMQINDSFPWWHGAGIDRDIMLDADCFEYTARIPPTLTSRGSDKRQVPLARYHIIPGKTLSGFFNASLSQQKNSLWFYDYLIERTLGVLANKAKLIYKYKCNSEYCGNFLQQLNSMCAREVRYGDDWEGPLEGVVGATGLARALLYWLPANVVVGPRQRAARPRHTFDQDARFILRDDDTFRQLREINDAMESYIRDKTNWLKFHAAIRMLEQFIMSGRSEPYPCDLSQWIETDDDCGEGVSTPCYRIDTNSPAAIYQQAISRSGNANPFDDDPFCLLPQVTLSEALKRDNLVVAAAAIERVRRGTGVDWIYAGIDRSWRKWIERMVGTYGSLHKHISADYMVKKQFGEIYMDFSFSVGVVGPDAALGGDSWAQGPAWNVSTMSGQMIFDNSGRPVLLAVSDREASQRGEGWTFVYSNKTWSPVASTQALPQLFPDGATDSLDVTAIRFNLWGEYWDYWMKQQGQDVQKSRTRYGTRS